MGKKKKKQTLAEAIAEDKMLEEARVDVEATPPVPNEVEEDIDAQDGPQFVEVIEGNPLADAMPETVESVEDVKPGQHFDLGPDDLGNIVTKEDIGLEGGEAKVSGSLTVEPTDPETGSDPEAPEAVESGEGDTGTDEPYDEPETQEPPEEPDAPEEEDEPEVEPSARKVNPRNTRR